MANLTNLPADFSTFLSTCVRTIGGCPSTGRSAGSSSTFDGLPHVQLKLHASSCAYITRKTAFCPVLGCVCQRTQSLARNRRATLSIKDLAGYIQLKPGNIPARTLASTTTRIKQIFKQCVRFSACHSTIVAAKPTGVNEDDIIRSATALFNNIKIKDPTEDIGKPFKFLQSWMLLRFHEKFLAGTTPESSTPSNARTMPEHWALLLTMKGSGGEQRCACYAQRNIAACEWTRRFRVAEAHEYFKMAQEEALVVARAKAAPRRAPIAPNDDVN
eukprot:IDg2374t1